MGCLGSKEDENPKETEKPTYSWDRRERLDPKDYTISDLKGATAGRTPGTINGQQFFIQNCEDSNIFLLDHTASVFIDDCINCRVVIAPSKGSVFFRDCKECSCVVACQQFRTRDCKKMEIFLCCATQPIIESSTGMKFGCFSYYYPELEGQFDSAGLSVHNNNWSNIHDFTPAEGEATWTLLSEATVVQEFIPLPETEEFKDVQISTDQDSSIVPITLGSRRKPYDESCLVLFFHDNNAKGRVLQFLNQIKSKGGVLVQSKEVRMKPEDVIRIFQSDYYAAAANRGPVISFEVNAKDSIQECKRITSSLSDNTIDSSVYVSPSPSKAAQDIDGFYNFVDMSMV